jgi:hypothetical protein
MTDCVQDMMYTMRALQFLELKVKLPMVVHCDNKGVVDLVNGWTTSGCCRHVATKIMFSRKLKDRFIQVKWVPGEEMVSSVFTQNLGDKDFGRCVGQFEKWCWSVKMVKLKSGK